MKRTEKTARLTRVSVFASRLAKMSLALGLVLMTGCAGESGREDVSKASSSMDQNASSTLISDTESQTEVSELSQAVEDGHASNDQHEKENVIVVYFSATGTTKEIAERLADQIGCDTFEIVPAEPYTEEDLDYYNDCRADREQEDPSARPEIAQTLSSLDDYDTVLVGYPIWHGKAPRIISTFMESGDFSGKRIIPFCTSGGSSASDSDQALHDLVDSSAKWDDPTRFEASADDDMLQSWIDEHDISAR